MRRKFSMLSVIDLLLALSSTVGCSSTVWLTNVNQSTPTGAYIVTVTGASTGGSAGLDEHQPDSHSVEMRRSMRTRRMHICWAAIILITVATGRRHRRL